MKKKLWIPLIAAVVLLAGLWLWYARPMTLEELNPGVELGQCVKIVAYQGEGGPWEIRKDVELLPGDPAFESLMELLEGRTFRRCLWKNLLVNSPIGAGSIHVSEEGAFRWDLSLYFEEIPLSNGEVIQNGVFYLQNIYGELLLINGLTGDPYIKTSDQKQWSSEVRSLILQGSEAAA